MTEVSFTYDTARNLPKNQYAKTVTTPAEEEGGEITQTPTIFMGWNAVPESLAASCADEAKILNLTGRDGVIIDFYAIWDDAPQFVITAYPDRYFTLEEAQNGSITEQELLATVVAFDRETNPLLKKDEQAVADSGNDVGITTVGYNAEDFTSLTDDSVISIRYKVKDTTGNQTFLSISVFISRNGTLPESERAYYRSISEEYLDESSDKGGLAEDSYWREKTPEEENDYAKLLEQALSETPTNAYDLRIGKTQLYEIKDHVDRHGFGNMSSGNLNYVWEILGE